MRARRDRAILLLRVEGGCAGTRGSGNSRRRASGPDRVIHAEDNTCGAPRITAELNDGAPAGERVNHKRVARVLREHSIVGYRRRRRVRTTIPEPSGQKVPDLFKRDFTAPAPNQKYVGDITYLPLADGANLYLARLVVRRIPDLAPKAHADQPGLFQVWRHHAFFTTTPHEAADTVAVDKIHRGHAIIEQVHADPVIDMVDSHRRAPDKVGEVPRQRRLAGARGDGVPPAPR